MNDNLRLCWRWVPLIQLSKHEKFYFDPAERGRIYVSSRKEMNNLAHQNLFNLKRRNIFLHCHLLVYKVVDNKKYFLSALFLEVGLPGFGFSLFVLSITYKL